MVYDQYFANGTTEPTHQIFIQTTIGLYHKVVEGLRNKSHPSAVPAATLQSLSSTSPWKSNAS